MKQGMKRALAGLLLAAFASAAPSASFADMKQAPRPVAASDVYVNRQAASHAGTLHFAYINTPSASVNALSHAGLNALAIEVIKRTSVTPADSVGLDIERDELALYPFIYWPVQADMPSLSVAAKTKVQSYLDRGGIILFDTQGRGGNSQTLARLLDGISIKPLVEMADDHALGKSFYIVSGLSGAGYNQDLWVENDLTQGADSVSSVMIGDTNWAAAWAGRSLAADSRERELALRAGVNMVIYALTGTYKNDPVHAPLLKDRLQPAVN